MIARSRAAVESGLCAEASGVPAVRAIMPTTDVRDAVWEALPSVSPCDLGKQWDSSSSC
jgi:hypothetical protein